MEVPKWVKWVGAGLGALGSAGGVGIAMAGAITQNVFLLVFGGCVFLAFAALVAALLIFIAWLANKAERLIYSGQEPAPDEAAKLIRALRGVPDPVPISQPAPDRTQPPPVPNAEQVPPLEPVPVPAAPSDAERAPRARPLRTGVGPPPRKRIPSREVPRRSVSSSKDDRGATSNYPN